MAILEAIKIGGNKQRNSSIEALRLLSMLMVLNLHSFWGYNHGDGFLQFADFLRESSSICAVDVFILISGYYSIRWKFKSFYNLIFQCIFYSFAIYFVAVYLGVIEFSMPSFLNCFGCTFSSWSFITCYIVLYIISPILNAFVDKTTNRQLLTYILLLFIAENTICLTTSLLNYILLYLIGRFINKNNIVSQSEKKPWLPYLFCTFIMTVIVYLIYLYTPLKTAEQMTKFPLGYSYGSPLVIIQACLLFLCFARSRFTSKVINWAAASSLAIFLIHMHPAIKFIGYYKITREFYQYSVWQHSVYLLFLMVTVFLGAILIDKIRIIISELLYLLLIKIKQKLPSKLFVINTYIPKGFRMF